MIYSQNEFFNQEFFANIKDIDIRSISQSEFLEIKKVVETYGVVVVESQNLNDDDQINDFQILSLLELDYIYLLLEYLALYSLPILNIC